MNFKLILVILTLFAATPASVSAATRPDERVERQQKWRAQLREYKHNMLAKALNLSAEQKSSFFPLYDEMDDRLEALNNEVRDIDRQVTGEKQLSDVALDAYSRRLFEQKKLESNIELEYYDKFKTILTSKQLALLKHTETEIIDNLNKFYHQRRTPNDN